MAVTPIESWGDEYPVSESSDFGMEIAQIQVRGSSIPLHLRNQGAYVPTTSFSLSPSMTPTLSCSSTIASEKQPQSEKRMFILGMGFVGQSLALKLQNQGWSDSFLSIIAHSNNTN